MPVVANGCLCYHGRQVSTLNWSNVTATIQDDGATKTLIVNPATGNRFYRLNWQP